ncbi:MAG: sigma-54-dependent Fis family transcriptional regulator [Alphaproteobacteria bacterium]|nr:sigma-54-dependent Fis family transcriptional regulator [Alphaproteobacteria bacterium]
MDKAALVADDDRTDRRMVAEFLRSVFKMGVLEAENGKEAVRLLNKNEHGICLAVLDLNMPVMGGLETLEAINKNYPGVPVIVLTGSTDMESAVQAMRLGASDFLSKPVETMRLDVSVRNALKMSMMSQEISRLKRKADKVITFSDLVGHGTGLQESVQLGRKAALCDLPVLLTGETGTGKEMFAAAIHGESKRSAKPFIAVNCGAIPEKLVESILFGHEKGAFTGAIRKAPGKFLEASGGMIFLDEIGDLPLDAQVKLLRVLQQKEIEPVGADRAVSVDARVISATNKDLAQEVREGRFREDLYFRLNVLHIELPPLRARKDDIPVLSSYFVEKFSAAHHAVSKEINGDSLRKLQNHSWPGNVRELESVINRAMALCEEEILGPGHFSFVGATSGTRIPQSPAVSLLTQDGTFRDFKSLEQDIIAQALAYHHHNMSRTARVLGLAKSTLYAKLGSADKLKSA